MTKRQIEEVNGAAIFGRGRAWWSQLRRFNTEEIDMKGMDKMLETIQVLIVEDDFRIADINRQFVNRVEGFAVLDIVKTAEEALAYLREMKFLPQLILLDVYIPDAEGLSLFWTLRQRIQRY